MWAREAEKTEGCRPQSWPPWYTTVTRERDMRMNPPEKLVSHEFEQRVLGAALRGPGYHYLTDNGITRDMFTSAPHRVIFDAIKGMADARRDVDPSTVAEWLVFRDLNDDAVNAAYLWELVSMRNSGTDAEIVRAKAQMRKAWGVMASAQAAAADGNLDVSALIASLVKLDQPASSHEHNANAIIQAAIDEIERQVAGITAGVKYGEIGRAHV